MIIEGELKDYIVIPIEDLISIRNEIKTNNICFNKNDNAYQRNEARILFIEDLLEKYSK